jgi:hypothetical protein
VLVDRAADPRCRPGRPQSGAPGLIRWGHNAACRCS